MKLLPIILSLFLSFAGFSQINMTQFDIPVQKEKIKWKRYLLPAGTAFLSGAFDGVNQTVLHHYSAFKRVFPDANDQWNDPRISHRNKWKIDENGKVLVGEERFLFSSNWLVWTTDNYHATRTGDQWMISMTIMFHPERYGKKWWEKGLEVVGYSLMRKAGFHATYSVLFKS